MLCIVWFWKTIKYYAHKNAFQGGRGSASAAAAFPCLDKGRPPRQVGQTDKQANKQTDKKQTNRQKDKQTDKRLPPHLNCVVLENNQNLCT